LLLVDEFQDTDPVQYDIVLLLAEEDGGSAEDPYSARLAPGRLFIVGDPKQSIYRFRGADYASFKRAVDRVGQDGGQHLDLTVNFRSTESVLSPINALFQDPSVWTDSPYQPDYVPIHAHGDAGEGGETPAVELWSVETDATTATGRRHNEADALARELRRLAATPACRYSDITILFRAFSNIDIYLRALRQAGIPFVVAGGSRDFDQRREVEDLVAILRALARPGDPIALLAFLRSPAGGVPDTELSTHSGADGSWNWSEGNLPDESALPRLHRAISLMRRLASETRLLPVDGVIGHVIRNSPLLPLSAAAHEGPQRVANLRRLAGLAVAMTRDGSLDLNDVVDALQDAGRSDLEGDSPLADEQEEAVRIMTVHKAKGLENGIVIIPDLSRGNQNPGSRDLTAQAPFLPQGGRALAMEMGEYCSPAWVWHQAEEERHEQAEEMRVLYVALTRARHRLILMTAGGSGGAWLKALSAWGYTHDSMPGDDQLLAGGTVRHRIISVARGDDHRQVLEPPDTDEAVAGWDQAIARLRASSGALLRHPSGLTRREPSVWIRTRVGISPAAAVPSASSFTAPWSTPSAAAERTCSNSFGDR
jgi:ATP-dependent helicase/nuclease subunit A